MISQLLWVIYPPALVTTLIYEFLRALLWELMELVVG